ncbi:MAG: nucleoside-triphosphatase [Candidatus Bipolaricaulia bacterium]
MVNDLLRLVLDHLDTKTSCPIIVSGSVGSGKSETSRVVAECLESEGYEPGGVLSPRLVDSGETVGYDVVDLATGTRRSFVRSSPPGKRVGRFFIKPRAVEFSNEAISEAIGKRNPVFVDEVGRLELKNDGLAPSIRKLLTSETQAILLVRSEFLPGVRSYFEIREYDEVRIENDELN